MAKIYSQLEGAQLENVTSDAATEPKGMVKYRTDLNVAKVSNGTVYKALIDEDATQTLANKTLTTPVVNAAGVFQQITTPANPSSGLQKIYPKSDGKFYTLDSAGNEAQLGGGAGGGVKNLITNGNADDTASSIFTPYADAAASRPVDGTGGSPTVTTSVSTSSPLDGVKSFLLTKPASNVQGQGWAVPFTVDLAYRAKAVKISVDFILNSGTFVAGDSSAEGDVIWYIYDVTNSQLIEPSNIKMFSNSSSLAGKFEGTFQTSATGSSYKLIAHVASTSASAFELKVDNVTVSPQVSGPVLGQMVARYEQTSATAASTSTPFDFQLKKIDTAGLVTTGAAWKFTAPEAGVYHVSAGLQLGGADSVYVYKNGTQHAFILYTSGNLGQGSVDVELNAGDYIDLRPGSAQTSSGSDTSFVSIHKLSSPASADASGRTMGFLAGRSTTQSIPLTTQTDVIFDSVLFDNTASYNASTGEVTVKESGLYKVNAQLSWSAFAGYTYTYIIKNGTVAAGGESVNDSSYGTTGATSILLNLKAGDVLKVQAYQDSGGAQNILADATLSFFEMFKLGGTPAVSANEVVAVKARTQAGQSIPTGTQTAIVFEATSFDTHGALNLSNGIFTAPVAGTYCVSAQASFNANATGSRQIAVFETTTGTLTVLERAQGLSGLIETIGGSTLVKVAAGGQIYINVFQDSGGALALTADFDRNSVSIHKI